MTFTRQDLLDAREFRESQEAERARNRKIEHEAWRLQQQEKDMDKVLTAFDDGLAKLLMESDTKGLNSLQLHAGKVFKNTTPKSEIYDATFTLGFDPDPSYKPTIRLLSILEDAGFQASVIEEKVEDITYVNDCVGFESCGTYHKEHYIVVSW